MKLEEKYRGNYVDGIFFTEAKIDEPITYLGKIKSGSLRMNSNLGKVKASIATQARWLKADAIMLFRYGQKRSLFSLWDDTKWYGDGVAIRLDTVSDNIVLEKSNKLLE